MAITLKIARSEKEVDDALWLRHEVFVIEDGKFGGKALPGARILDRYDAFPNVHNIVVYEDQEPVATMRMVKESAVGLPTDEYFDFGDYRTQAARELKAAGQSDCGVVLGSAGMLAIRGPWRVRRDVIRAMFRIAAGVAMNNAVTHIVVAVNHETAGMYRRLGFQRLTDKFWVEEVGNFIVPLAGSVEGFHKWAFGDLPPTPLNTFQDSFERFFVRAGEVVFSEGDLGDMAFIVDQGIVRISRLSPAGEELTLARLTRGDLFGELALVDEAPRSATVTAVTDCELITLDREAFMDELYAEPERIRALLNLFSRRIRRMDDFAMVLAFSPLDQRLDFALRMAKTRSSQDRKDKRIKIFKGGVDEFATLAGVDHDTVLRYLEERRDKGELDYSPRHIRFFA
ncbi:MAG: cyclic nucleotide-binding domain-containing protein [Gammaproteobacteria bacterium]|nr:cyclic nucleotide-binding domain-containing protein [Gammaproteobacteria bacterium]